jgi:medium-chain acyl-[acyl-carrier-protein] hydrolase
MGICDSYVYRSEPPLRCPIVAFGGATDLEAPPADLDAWRDQTTSAFSRHLFPGGHFYIHAALRDVQRIVAGELAPPTGGGTAREASAGNR